MTEFGEIIEEHIKLAKECQGHPDDGRMEGPVGETSYCNGSCVPDASIVEDVTLATIDTVVAKGLIPNDDTAIELAYVDVKRDVWYMLDCPPSGAV